MALKVIDEYFIIMPLILQKAIPVTKFIQSVFVPTHLDLKQIFITTNEKIAIDQAKQLANVFSQDPIGIFKCSMIIEATGKCPYVVKKFNDKGELIPTEVFING